jgi:hypothetical protein
MTGSAHGSCRPCAVLIDNFGLMRGWVAADCGEATGGI